MISGFFIFLNISVVAILLTSNFGGSSISFQFRPPTNCARDGDSRGDAKGPPLGCVTSN